MNLPFIDTNVTLNQLIAIFNEIATNHAQINCFGYGQDYEIGATTTENYPLLWVWVQPSKISNQSMKFIFRVHMMDLVNSEGTGTQQNEVQSDTINTLWDIVFLLRDYYDLQVSFDISANPFTEAFNDRVTGWYMDVNIEVPQQYGVCDAPFKSCVSGSTNFAGPYPYDPIGCGNCIRFEDSSSIAFSGSGTTCDPLSATVKISSVAGNDLFIFDDGLYTSGAPTSGVTFPVTSVFGRTGDVIADCGDYALCYYPLNSNPAHYLTSGDTVAQQNSDWNSTSGVTAILNKPTNVSYWYNDVAYIRQSTSGSTSNNNSDGTTRPIIYTDFIKNVSLSDYTQNIPNLNLLETQGSGLLVTKVSFIADTYFGNSIANNVYGSTGSDKFTARLIFKPLSKSSTPLKIGIGILANQIFFKRNLGGFVNLSSAASGTTVEVYETVGSAWNVNSTGFTYDVGDTLVLELRQIKNTVRVTVFNVNKGTSLLREITNSYPLVSQGSLYGWSMGQFAIFPSTSDINILSFKVSNDYGYADVVMCGNSIANGSACGSSDQTYFELIKNSSYLSFALDARLAAVTRDVATLSTREVFGYKPRYVIMDTVGNDYLDGATIAEGYYLDFVNKLKQDGITVIHFLAPPRNGNSAWVLAINAWLTATFPNDLKLDLYTLLKDPSSTNINPAYDADGTHLNASGHTAVANAFSAQFPQMIQAGASTPVVSGYYPFVAVASPLTNTLGTLGILIAGSGTTGALSSTDWNTFNNKQNAISFVAGTSVTISGTTSVFIGVGNSKADGATLGIASFTASDFNDNGLGLISIDYTNGQKSTSGTTGFLTSTDWNTFNNKQSAISFVAGTSVTISGTTSIFIGVGNAKADGATRGIAMFTAADFNDNGSGLISIDYTNGQKATSGTTGFLTSADWITFNSKQNAISFVAGTSVTISGTTAIFIGVGNAKADGSTLGIAAFTAADFNDNGSGLISIDYTNGQKATSGTTGFLTSADWIRFNSASGTTYTFSTGLTNNSSVITANLSTGVPSGQTAIGGTQSGENLTLTSTSNATKGKIYLGSAQACWFDETTKELDINLLVVGSASPHVAGTITVYTVSGNYGQIKSSNADIIITSSLQTAGQATFRLLPFVNDIYFQNTNSTGDMFFDTANGGTRPLTLKGGGNVLVNAGILGIGVAAPTGNGLLQVKAGSQTTLISKVGGTIVDHLTTSGNTGTSESDMFSVSLAASLLAANGDTVSAVYAGNTVASATATRQIRVYFGGTMIFDSTAQVTASIAQWTINVVVVRDSSTSVKCTVSFISTNFVTNVFSTYTAVTGLTLTNAQVLKITGQAASAGAATNDISAKFGKIEFKPGA